MNVDPEVTAKAFAKALDCDDFAAASGLLSEDCIYLGRTATFVGPQAICESYRQASAWARQNLDSVAYESSVQPPVGARVAVVLSDEIVHGGMHHSYRCKQVLSVNFSGKVERIEHVELPGQREGLNHFLALVGITRT